MPRVNLPFVDLHVEEAGDPAAPTLLLLHDGASTARRDFGPLIPGLAASLHVIAPDFRGHGESSPIGGGIRFQWPIVARDVVDLLDFLGVDEARVVGLGDGATVALHLLLEAPRRVEAAVLAGARAHVTHDDIVRLDALRPENVKAGAPALAEVFALQHGAGYWELLLDRYVASFRIDRAYLDVRHRLASVHKPVLLLHGVDDALTPAAHGETLADGIPEARLVLMDGGRSVQKHPAFPGIVEGFLKEPLSRTQTSPSTA